MRHLIGCALGAALSLPTAGAAATATLQELLDGATLTEQDLVFDDFFWRGTQGFFAPIDDTATPDEISLSTSVVVDSVELEVRVTPGLRIDDQSALFDVLVNFSVSVLGSSSRTIESVKLFNSDVFASGDGRASVTYDIMDTAGTGLGDVEIFEDATIAPGNPFNPASQESDLTFVGNRTALEMEGRLLGEVDFFGSAGLSVFLLKFDMDRAYEPPVLPPPPGAVPLPASAVLLLGGLAGLGLTARRRRG